MTDRRRKNVQWNLILDPNKPMPVKHAQLAVLMDLRDNSEELAAAVRELVYLLKTVRRKIQKSELK